MFTPEDIEKGLAASKPVESRREPDGLERPSVEDEPVRPVLAPATNGTIQRVDEARTKAAVIPFDARGRLVLPDMDSAWRYAVGMVKNDQVPATYWGSRNKPRTEGQCTYAVFSAVVQGRKFGFDPLESVRMQYFPGNMPVFWGKAVPGIVKSQLRQIGEWYTELLEYKGAAEDRSCVVKLIHTRNDKVLAEIVRTFSIRNAKDQGLLNKDTWKHSADRMLMHRARTYALDDLFPDIMCGLPVGEVEEDYLVLDENRERKTLDERLAAAKEKDEPGAA